MRGLCPISDRIDMTHVNILAELYMAMGQHEETYSLIQRAERMVEEGDETGVTASFMPLDLTAKAGKLPRYNIALWLTLPVSKNLITKKNTLLKLLKPEVLNFITWTQQCRAMLTIVSCQHDPLQACA